MIGSINVSFQPGKFGGQRHCGYGDDLNDFNLSCDVARPLTKGSSKFKGGRFSR